MTSMEHDVRDQDKDDDDSAEQCLDILQVAEESPRRASHRPAEHGVYDGPHKTAYRRAKRVGDDRYAADPTCDRERDANAVGKAGRERRTPRMTSHDGDR